MYIDVGTYISWMNEPSVPFNSGTVSDLQGFSPGDHNSMGCISVTNGDGSIWTINAYNIMDMGGMGAAPIISNVNIDEYAIGNAVSQGIVNSGMLNNQYVPDNTPQLDMIASTLQQLLDKDKPKEIPPVVIPEVEDEYLIL